MPPSSTATTNTQAETLAPGALAPRWHTAALVALYLAVAATGALLRRGGAPLADPSPHGPRIVATYAPILAVQWGLLVYVCRIGRTSSALGSLLGAPPTRPRAMLLDLALAAVAFVAIRLVELAWLSLFPATNPPSVVAMLPQTPLECLAWSVVAASVGFCEEVVFRGYLQTQLGAFTGRAGVAIALQAALFGIAHGEQGVAAMTRIALYGLLLGVLAWWRRSLVPGILCHAGTDVASGWIAFFRA